MGYCHAIQSSDFYLYRLIFTGFGAVVAVDAFRVCGGLLVLGNLDSHRAGLNTVLLVLTTEGGARVRLLRDVEQAELVK
jgi:hypothetical protein